MFPVNETLKIFNNQIINLNCHNRRFNKTRHELFSLPSEDISSYIDLSELDPEKVYKCRIVYASEILSVTFEQYQIRNIRNLKKVKDDSISYDYKFNDRSSFSELLKQKNSCDDILIIKNGKVTDTSFSNIVFSDSKTWITPSSYLLNGTTRQRLLDSGKIIQGDINEKDIGKFKIASLINAFYDIGDLVVRTSDIL